MTVPAHALSAAFVRAPVRAAHCLVLLVGFAACQGHRPEQPTRFLRPFSSHVLDSLTTAFLVHARD